MINFLLGFALTVNSNQKLPKTNSSPLKIGHPKKETSIPTIRFQELLLLVSGSVSFLHVQQQKVGYKYCNHLMFIFFIQNVAIIQRKALKLI